MLTVSTLSVRWSWGSMKGTYRLDIKRALSRNTSLTTFTARLVITFCHSHVGVPGRWGKSAVYIHLHLFLSQEYYDAGSVGVFVTLRGLSGFRQGFLMRLQAVGLQVYLALLPRLHQLMTGSGIKAQLSDFPRPLPLPAVEDQILMPKTRSATHRMVVCVDGVWCKLYWLAVWVWWGRNGANKNKQIITMPLIPMPAIKPYVLLGQQANSYFWCV